jgi:hypothetical protein
MSAKKKLKKIALEWNEEHRADFVAWMAQYVLKQAAISLSTY